jgi:hypothetical protein
MAGKVEGGNGAGTEERKGTEGKREWRNIGWNGRGE